MLRLKSTIQNNIYIYHGSECRTEVSGTILISITSNEKHQDLQLNKIQLCDDLSVFEEPVEMLTVIF